jgi:hypothetical protein
MSISNFHTRLAETIAWCSLQNIENDPPETEEFRHREQLARQGTALYRRAQLLEKKNSVQSWLLDHLHLGPREDTKELRRQGLEFMRAGDVTSILPLNNQLRTPALRPQPFVWPQTDRSEIVEELSEKRAALLHAKNAYPQVVFTDLAGGRLLAYEPDDNVEDGASQHQSKGYFDGKDAPPWDTWICYVDRSLISWVPSLLLDLAQRGVAVNCVDCIRWVEDGFLNETLTATAKPPSSSATSLPENSTPSSNPRT